MGLLLTAPAASFIFLRLLKHAMGMQSLFDAAEPFLHLPGAGAPVSGNSSLLLLGPLLTFLLNAAFSVACRRSADAVPAELSLQQELWNLAALCLSGICLFILLLYSLGVTCA